jgi:transcriptional regulator with XRE-family HTH domain
MSMTEKVLSEFIDNWNAGRRPNIRDYLKRVPEGPERDDLAEQLTTWLELAPAPDFDEATLATIRSEPMVQQVLGAVGENAGLWPKVLPQLRERRGLSIAQVATSLVERLGLRAGSEQKTAGYMARLERGELEASRVSRRLLDALGDLLGASGGTLADAGGFGAGLRPTVAGGSLFRATEEPNQRFARDLEMLSRAAMSPAPPPMDEVDELFIGGPGA